MKSKALKLAGGLTVTASLVIGGKMWLKKNAVAVIPEMAVDLPQPSGLPWDYNWDRRAPESCVKPPKKGSDNQEYEQRLAKATPTAVRNLLLVRHGQYEENTKDKWLTDLGREQAEMAGKYLQSLNVPVDRIIWSTKNRATETGKIISKYFKDIPTESCQLLEEGEPPVAAEPQHRTWIPDPKAQFVQGARMEAAFRKYFHRASPRQTEDSYEIVACHGNVIRYCTLRALQLPASAWLNLSAYNGSVTWVKIGPDGFVSLVSFGDTGFIPPDKITYWLAADKK